MTSSTLISTQELDVTTPRRIEIMGNTLELLAEVDRSPRASVVRYIVAPGFMAPPTLHHHVHDDVTMSVLEGSLIVTGLAGDVTVAAGQTLALPHGTPFAWRNGSADERAVYVAVYAPGGFEQYFVAVADALAAGRQLGPDVIGPLWERYGIAVSTGPGRAASGS